MDLTIVSSVFLFLFRALELFQMKVNREMQMFKIYNEVYIFISSILHELEQYIFGSVGIGLISLEYLKYLKNKEKIQKCIIWAFC